MHKQLRAFLEQNGLRASATEQEAWDLYSQLQADGVEYDGETGVPTAGQRSAGSTGPTHSGGGEESGGDAGSTPAISPDMQRQIDDQVTVALTNDTKRRAEIGDRLRIAGLTDHDNGNFARSLIDNPKMSIDDVGRMIFAELEKRAVPLGAGVHSGFEVGTESRDKFRAAALDGMLLRSGVQIAKPAAGAVQFRGRSLLHVARRSLELIGIDTRDMGRNMLASRALASGSSSDFPLLMSQLAGKRLQAAYVEFPATWKPFVAVTDAVDFKDIHSLKLSGSPDLEEMDENGEYKTAHLSEAKEKYKVITKGKKIPLTRNMIVNDDLRAFARIPLMFAASARRGEADAVYTLLTSNPVMSDSKALFHAGHNNLEAILKGPVTTARLTAARTAMRKQKGMKGELIDVTPAFLVVPVALETDADIILRSSALPDDNKSSGVHNPWAGKLTPVADPRLDVVSAVGWYLLAHPNQAPVIEVAYLEGEEQPYIDEQIDFNSDALVIKVRHDFGAGLIGHEGAFKNPGE